MALIAHAGIGRPHRDERRDARDRRDARLAQHVRGRRDRRLVVAGVDLRHGAPGEDVAAPRVEVAFCAVGEAVGDDRRHLDVPLELDGGGSEVAVRARHVLRVAGGPGHLEAALELLDPPGQPGLQLRAADVVERVHDDLVLAELLRERERAAAPLAGGVEVGGQHRELAAVGERHRQLPAGRELLELHDRLGGEALGLGVAALEPVEAGQPATGVALRDAVAELAVAQERLLARLDRIVDLVGQVALVRAALEQDGAVGDRQLARPAQGARVLGRGLAVGAEQRGALSGGGGVAEHGGGVAGRLGVMREPGRVGAAGVEPLEHIAVQRGAATRRDLRLQRQARELVPERDGAALESCHPREQALVERLVGGVDQLGVGGSGDDGQALEQLLRRGAQVGRPCQHRVAHGGRDGGRGRPQHLGDVEGVAAGAAVQVVAVDAVRLRQLAHGLGAQRREPDPLDGAHRGELAEHDPQRVVGLVTEGDDGERGHAVDPAAEQPQHVERALVGPVDVFEHEHGPRLRAQLAQQRGDQRGRPRCPPRRPRAARRRPRRRRRAAGRAAAACAAGRRRPRGHAGPRRTGARARSCRRRPRRRRGSAGRAGRPARRGRSRARGARHDPPPRSPRPASRGAGGQATSRSF